MSQEGGKKAAMADREIMSQVLIDKVFGCWARWEGMLIEELNRSFEVLWHSSWICLPLNKDPLTSSTPSGILINFCFSRLKS